MERSSEIIPEKVFLMLMTPLTTSQRDVKRGLLYSCLKEIVTFSAIQVAVCNQSSLNLVHICSPVRHIGLQMLLVKGQITRSRGKKNRSNFEIAITPSIVELERRTKAQNVGDSMAYRGIILNFQYNFQFNRLLWPQNGVHLKNLEIL